MAAFSDMESLTSSSGKLLSAGWWGWLRHSNILGDIIMHWALVLPCGNSYVFPIHVCVRYYISEFSLFLGFHVALPFLVATFITVCLLYRAKESDLAGKLKYGPSWDRYCQRVPSRVIPRVF